VRGAGRGRGAGGADGVAGAGAVGGCEQEGHPAAHHIRVPLAGQVLPQLGSLQFLCLS
jgi:hypothetical protein